LLLALKVPNRKFEFIPAQDSGILFFEKAAFDQSKIKDIGLPLAFIRISFLVEEV
jgi:hypothetical protein